MGERVVNIINIIKNERS